MLKRVVSVIAIVTGLLLLAGAAVLVPAHVGIRRVNPELPSLDVVRATTAAVSGGPVRLSWINTSSQEVPRRGVLGGGDPHPKRPYRLCHTSFVLEWADGRILLIDAGMTRDQAESFGRMGELIGAQPTEVYTTASEALGDDVDRVAGVIFSHLHVDHVDGARELCAGARSSRIPVFMTSAQTGSTNHTTSDVQTTVHSLPCLQPTEVGGSGLLPVPGFPGLYLIAAGGHTPGSQIAVAVVDGPAGREVYAFTGDIVNNLDGIRYDVGKPALYSALIVPESGERLGELRRFLRSLNTDAGVRLLVPHDEYALAESGVPLYEGEARR